MMFSFQAFCPSMRFNTLSLGMIILAAGMMGATLVGCGSNTNSGSADIGSSSPASNIAAMSGQGSPVAAQTLPATDVVSQFLDLVRRGGGDSGASTLLTAKAQSELNRIGRTVQPIGSPDARFVVTRAESLPENPDATLVHSVWTEPASGNSGESANSDAVLEYQVVWALQKESNQWRISGLAMEIDPEQNPLIVNFEDGNRMAALLAETESGDQSENSGSESAARSGPAASNAAAQDPTPNR